MTGVKKQIAVITAASVIAAMAGCSNSDGSTAGSSDTSAATMKEEHAEAVEQIEVDAEKLENGTLRWLSFYDLNPAPGEPVPVCMELFEKKYGGKVQYIPTTWDTRFDDLATLVVGGDSPDMFPASDVDIFPGKVAAGMFDPMDDYLDFGSEDWGDGPSQINEFHSIGGKHYLACVASNAGFIMIYNKNTIEENGLDDPAELAYNNEWTWTAFRNMCTEFADREQDKYAVGGWWYEPAMILSTGMPVIGMNNGVIENNIMTPEIERVETLFREMKQADLMFPYAEYDWTDFPERIGEGKTLFYPVGSWALYEPDISCYGDPEDIMFVPMPRDESADEWYLTATGGLDAYAMCKGAKNPEAVAAFVNCKLIEKNDESANEVSLEKLKNEYHWSDEMIEMYDYIGELTEAHPMIDFYTAVNSDVNDILFNNIKDASYNGTDWFTLRDSINGIVQTNIDEMNAVLEKIRSEN